jgi:hypothetical protein
MSRKIRQINKYAVEKLKELVKSSSLTEDKLVRVKKPISEDHELDRLVAAQKITQPIPEHN